MDILSRKVLVADHCIPYGSDPSQFGDLWLPAATSGQLLPLVVFFHGGWWKSEYDLGYAGFLCDALKKRGIACWSVEYRRVGSTGGGWPATFHDAASGFEFAATLARAFPLDLNRVITLGHSAGGHLAFWIAGRHHIDSASAIYNPRPRLPLRGALALAGAVDLGLTIDLAGDGLFAHDRDEVHNLMGGTPRQFPERYKAGGPAVLLPFNIPQVLLQGTDDDQIPPDLPTRWAASAKQAGDTVAVTMIPNADHFSVVDPESHAWPTVLSSIRYLLR